jgi:DNA-binding response OmpR family regulator
MPTDTSQPATQPPAATRAVLLIEDEHFISELYARALLKAGFSVDQCVDGAKALEMVKTKQYDIILLDIMVPNITGLDILNSLRYDVPGLTAKIIITTNLDQGEEARKQVEKLADGYLIKAEITPKELVGFLQNIK